MKEILIAEDNEQNLKLFKVLVSSLGYKVLTAQDGGECVKIAKERTPLLILMDIQMPGVDGITALKMLRESEETKNIPVIALTAFMMKGDCEKFLEEGFIHYIAKPIDKDSFLRDVKEIAEKINIGKN